MTLTIEAGTSVNLNNYHIVVNGTLFAKGTSTDKIQINGVDGSPPPSPLGSSLTIPFNYGIIVNSYNQNESGSIFENAIINSVRISLGSFGKINNSTINGFVSVGQSSLFINNIVIGIVFAGGNSQILNNNISGMIETSNTVHQRFLIIKSLEVLVAMVFGLIYLKISQFPITPLLVATKAFLLKAVVALSTEIT